MADLAALARRVDAATPAHRDRAVDALRALAILGVVLGHWLVTAVTVDAEGRLRTASPLAGRPELVPVSWLLQTLAVFFLVGGCAGVRSLRAAEARGVPYQWWVRRRLARLARPVAGLLGLWGLVTVGLVVAGVDLATVHTLGKLVVSPLWFLLVYAVLTALTRRLARLHPLWPLAVVLHVDLLRFGLGLGEEWVGWTNLLAGWAVPYCLGTAWANGAFPGRRGAAALLAGGAVATVALVVWADYPAAMVGVPGAPVSNLSPPTLAAVCFGLAQCGGALLLRGSLRRWMRRPSAWAAVALLNLSAMTVFLWHQTALLAVTATGLSGGRRLPGLHTPPDGAAWVLARLGWLPAFAVVLGVCLAAFGGPARPGAAPPGPAPPGAGDVGSDRGRP